MKKLAVFFFAFLAVTGAKADCTSLFNELHDYMQAPTIGNCQPNFNSINVKMATNRSDNRYVSYSEGLMTAKTIAGGGRLGRLVVASFSGDTSQIFSDRSKEIYDHICDSSTPFCLTTKQIFTVSATDKLNLNFQDSAVTLTLKSWGNGKMVVPVECTPSGMMIGEVDGTLFTFSFKKDVYVNQCIR